jgi:hypothetical protein
VGEYSPVPTRLRFTRVRRPYRFDGNDEGEPDVFIECPHVADVRLADEPPTDCVHILEHVVSNVPESTIRECMEMSRDGLMGDIIGEAATLPADFDEEI